MKPVIGITCSYSKDDKTQFKLGLGTLGQEWNMLAEDYVSAIERAGGIPILIPCLENIDLTKDILDKVDGLLVSGGNDIDPLIFGKRSDKKTGIICERRDKQELFAAKYIIEETQKPYLGICRGLQVLNVALGGTLHLDLEDSGYLAHSLGNNDRYNPVHKAKLKEDSLLYKIFGKEEIYINSFHHQAADKIAPSLEAVAISEDDVIEAVELRENKDRFVLAVQWHPEMMSVKNKEQQKVLDEFVESCKKNK